ncbi:MAG: DsbA family protein [Patulibacter sp.]
MSTVTVTTFTDPACPFAYSAEPIRWRLRWRYGDQLEWRLRLVGLSRDGASYAQRGFTPEQAAASLRNFDRYGQPLTEATSRPVGGTWEACRAIVAVREHAGLDRAVHLLGALHALALGDARELSAADTIAEAVAEVGITIADLDAWRADPAVETAFAADLTAARRPSPAALALDQKLAPAGDEWDPDPADVDPSLPPASGRRYTCPSYVLSDGERVLEAPGFHTALTIETLVANLAPRLEQRPWAEDPLEVLRWAGQPLTTQEVAAVLDRDDERDDVAALLRELGATAHPLGNDARWTI